MLDTHIAIALHDGRSVGLSSRSKRLIERGETFISPMVVFEMELLHEIGRSRTPGMLVAKSLTQDFGIDIANDPFANVVAEALGLAFTRDPFDRLIVAHASLRKAPLVTFDEQIHRHYRPAMR